ncbi:hypothetical protein COO60DRAFT_1462777 [Scenedesmus sp. NREL 46B-D3]|nr:hypothetical protein COO60DRAFT_1462777 [Scenedesmus sp. NREL 46B-D3]
MSKVVMQWLLGKLCLQACLPCMNSTRLPSRRFGLGSSRSNKSSSRDGSSYAGAREQWRLVAAQQQEVEGAVAAHMRSYARHRARLEEEMNRKQEAAVQLSAVQQLHDPAAAPVCGASQGSRQGRQQAEGGGTRVLLHVDSQHQPSQVATAYTGLAAGAGWTQRLVPVDKVKEAKQQLLQVLLVAEQRKSNLARQKSSRRKAP